MKKILLLVHPKYCKLIFNGEKTIEVRRSRPKLEPPFEVLVYETKGQFIKSVKGACTTYGYGRGKVIGSFICDKIEKINIQAQINTTLSERWTFNGIAKQACLTAEQLKEYLNGGTGYGWHITEPKLFDKPKEFYELYAPCKKNKQTADENCKGCVYAYKGTTTGEIYCDNALNRPPLSWCYVEED